MVTLLRKIDILKIIEMVEMKLAFEKLNKCWGKNTKHHISDILKELFYSLKQFFNWISASCKKNSQSKKEKLQSTIFTKCIYWSNEKGYASTKGEPYIWCSTTNTKRQGWKMLFLLTVLPLDGHLYLHWKRKVILSITLSPWRTLAMDKRGRKLWILEPDLRKTWESGNTQTL